MLLDTSGLMCLFDRREIRHSEAIEYYGSASTRLTHNYVLAEFIALVTARRAPRKNALGFVEAIVRSGEIEVIWVGEDLHERAMLMLTKRIDKAWSLCDAVSFEIMHDRNESSALTTDHDFEQAGFSRLLAK